MFVFHSSCRYAAFHTLRLKMCHLLNAEKVQAKGVPGGSLKPKEKATTTPVKLTSSKLKPDSSASDKHPLQKTIHRRQRLQKLYEELQALGD